MTEINTPIFGEKLKSNIHPAILILELSNRHSCRLLAGIYGGEDGFPIKDFGNDHYFSYYLSGLYTNHKQGFVGRTSVRHLGS